MIFKYQSVENDKDPEIRLFLFFRIKMVKDRDNWI